MDKLIPMKKNIWLFFFWTTLFVYACSNPVKDEHTAQMDSLLAKLAISLQAFDSINYPEFELRKQEAKLNLKNIQLLLKDTLNRDAAILISNYARIVGRNKDGKVAAGDTVLSNELSSENEKQAVEYGNKRQEYIKQEIELCVKQLKDLKHDYEHDLIKKEDLLKHLPSEAESARKIIDFIALEKNAVSHRMALHDSLNPGIERIIDSLKAVKIKQ